VIVAFTAITVAVVAVVGILTGFGLFGLHPLTLLSGDTVSVADGLLRTLAIAINVVSGRRSHCGVRLEAPAATRRVSGTAVAVFRKPTAYRIVRCRHRPRWGAGVAATRGVARGIDRDRHGVPG
jgi:hypothetical protein